jgi:hypothetical protein
MINIIFEPSLFLGTLFALVMIIFYCFRFFQPETGTEWDIFLTTLGIVYSAILIIHGWRLDPILLFSQVILIFITFCFCWSLLRQRGVIQKMKQIIYECEEEIFELESIKKKKE